MGGFKLDDLILSSNETPNSLTEVLLQHTISQFINSSNSHHDSLDRQAESPLDKQIKSSLLADAFNLLGVKRLDAQTLTSARLRARFLSLGGKKEGGNGDPIGNEQRAPGCLGYRGDIYYPIM